MTSITIDRFEIVKQGDEVEVRATVEPPYARPVTAAASPHGAKDSQEILLRPVGVGEYLGSFRPDRPGRWWVAVSHSYVTTEACLWVRARQVPRA